MNRIDFNELVNLVEDIDSLLDKKGNIDKSNPLYSSLKDLIFYNLLDEEAQEAINEFVIQQHSNLENVDLSYKQMFDILKQQGHIDTDPEDGYYSGLLDDEEYEKYQNMKQKPAFKDWNAKRFYESFAELNDRANNPQRLLLARLFKVILEEDKPIIAKPENQIPKRR